MNAHIILKMIKGLRYSCPGYRTDGCHFAFGGSGIANDLMLWYAYALFEEIKKIYARELSVNSYPR